MLFTVIEIYQEYQKLVINRYRFNYLEAFPYLQYHLFNPIYSKTKCIEKPVKNNKIDKRIISSFISGDDACKA